MSIILAIVIGLIALLAGVGMAYSLLEHRLNVQEQRHRTRTRRDIEEVERSYTERMQQRIDALKSQYETQIQQLTNQLEATPQLETSQPQDEAKVQDLTHQLETLKAQYEAQIQDLTQQLAAAQATPAAATPATATPTITTPTATTDSTPAIEPEAVTPPEPLLATESTESTAIPEPLPTKTIAPRSTGITLEELTTLPYLSEDTTRTRLAESLLEALQAQSRPEISQTFLLTTLKRLSEDPLPRLRELAVLCLAQLQSSKAVPILRPRLWDTDAAVVQAANQALEFWRSHGKRKQPTRKPKTRKASRQA